MCGKKKIRAKLVPQKKKSCRQVGLKKKFMHRKFFVSPPVISNGPSLKRRVLQQTKPSSWNPIHTRSNNCVSSLIAADKNRSLLLS